MPVATDSAIPVVFGADQSTTTITIPITNDQRIEGVENFLVHLRQVASFTGTLNIAAPSATVSIVDDDGELVENTACLLFGRAQCDWLVLYLLFKFRICLSMCAPVHTTAHVQSHVVAKFTGINLVESTRHGTEFSNLT